MPLTDHDIDCMHRQADCTPFPLILQAALDELRQHRKSALRAKLKALAEEWEQQADKQEAGAAGHENIDAILTQTNTLRYDSARIRKLLEECQ